MDKAKLSQKYNSMVVEMGRLELEIIERKIRKDMLVNEITEVVKNIKEILKEEEEAKKAAKPSAAPAVESVIEGEVAKE